MTRSTSAIAVWFSSDSLSSAVRERSSASRREFSMAITAWSAKVATSLVCASSKGRTSWRKIASTPTI